MYKYPFAYTCDNENGKYKYNLVFPTGEELIKVHDQMGVEKGAILPIVNAEVYVPQSLGEIIDFCKESNGRYVPFCNLDPRVLENKSDTNLAHLIEFYKEQGCVGMGEVLPNMPFNDPKLHNLFKYCEQANWPLIFDCSGQRNIGYGLWDDPCLPMLDEALSKFEKLVFVGHGPGFWAEFGYLDPSVPRNQYLSGPIEKEGAVIRLMRDHKNMWIDLSANSGYSAIARDLDFSRAFMKEFSDRIMYGTDFCYPTPPKYDMMGIIELFHNEGTLTDEQYEGITHKNAERLLGL
jgi:predicted TIM-barrel fold metal-dependent hydrolase